MDSLAEFYSVLQQDHVVSYNAGEIQPWILYKNWAERILVASTALLLYEIIITSGQELDFIWRFVARLFYSVMPTPSRKVNVVAYQCAAPANPVLRPRLSYVEFLWWIDYLMLSMDF